MPSEFVIPASLPLPLVNGGNEFNPIDIAARRERDAGEYRREPIYRSVPQRYSLAWLFEQTEFDIFCGWFEDQLLAGRRKFDLQVAKQGDGQYVWWTALFLGSDPPWTAEPIPASGRIVYRVNATLLLFGQPFDVREPPGIQASGEDSDEGGAYFGAPSIFASGTDGDTGGWYVAGLPIFASGDDEDDGGWNTDIEPAGADDDLMRVWMGLDIEPPVMEDEGALIAQALGF